MDRTNAERLLSGEPPPQGGESATPDLDRLLAAAARPPEVDPGRAEAQERAALEAFRSARAEALRAAGEGRGRDNWAVPLWRGRLFQPAVQRSARATLAGVLGTGAFVGTLLLAGTGSLHTPFTDVDSASTREPGGDGTATASAGSPAGSRGPAPETRWREPQQRLPAAEELCRTHLGGDGGGDGGDGGSGGGSGGSGEGDRSRLDPEGYDRLLASAGGESKVDGYCADMLGLPGPAEPGPDESASSAGNGNPGGSEANSGGGNANSGGNNANSGGGNANSGGSNANSGGHSSVSGGSNANSGGNNANSGGNNANSGGNNANSGGGNANSGGGNANSGGNNANSGGNNANAGGAGSG